MLDLKDACVPFLKKKLSPDNCFAISAFANRYDCTDLEVTANYYMEKNFSDAVKTEAFLALTKKEIIEVITNPRIFTSSEEEVFECVMAWINKDLSERQKFLVELMQFVKLPLLSDRYLKLTVMTEPLFSNNLVCIQYLTEAFEYKLLESQERALINTYWTKRRRSKEKVLIAFRLCQEKWKLEFLDMQKKEWMNFADGPPLNLPSSIDGVVVVHRMIYMFITSSATLLDGHTWPCNVIKKLDCETNIWSNCSKMNTDRCEFSIASLNNLIYAVGGRSINWPAKHLNIVEVYDPDFNTWSTIAPMSIERSSCGLCAVGGFLYAVGGKNHSGLLESVERYCPQSDTWTTCADMDYKREDAGVVGLNGLLYVVGGEEYLGIENYSTFPLQVYTPELNKWKSIDDMSIRKYTHTVVTMNNMIYTLGDFMFDYFHVYDPSLNIWKLRRSTLGAQVENSRKQTWIYCHPVAIDKPINMI